MSKSYKNSLKLIKKIQKVRSKNNSNWMDILRLAFKYDSKNSAKLMYKIHADDKKISRLVKKLYQSNK